MSAFIPAGEDILHLYQWLQILGLIAGIFFSFYAVLEAFGDYFARRHP